MKSFKNLILIAVAMVSLMVIGCKPDPYQGPVEIGVSQESLNIPKDGGEASLRLFTNRDWTASVDYSGGKDTSWISVGPDKGVASLDTVTVSLTVLANQGEDRQATVTFSTGTLTASVRISQEGLIKKTYTSISKVRELFKGENVTVTEDWTIKGVVLSDYRQETAGGLNNATSAKSVVVADSTAGIQLYLAANNTEFAKGDQVEVTLKGLELQRYQNGSLQVNAVPLANVKKVGEGVKVEPIAITAEQLLTGNYESRYVAVSDVQTTSAEEQTFVKGESHTSIGFTAKTGETFVLFSSKYSTYGAEKVPTGSGTLKGIAMVYGGKTYQISITSKDDYAGLTGARFGVDVNVDSKVVGDYAKWSAITPVTAFADDFSSFTEAYKEYVNDNWMFYTSDGSEVNYGFKTRTYNDDKYLEIAPYNSQAEQVVAYALMPKANVKGATKKSLSFKIALYYQTADNSKFEVVVSEDFAGDFEKATWTVVKDATFASDAPKNEWTEISVDLASYAEKEGLCIALRYTGKANTYRLDDVVFGDGSLSGGGDEGDEGDEGDGESSGSKVVGDYAKWSAITPVTAFADDFSSFTEAYKEYVNDNWMFYTSDGSDVDYGFKTRTYNDDKYIEIAPYASQAETVVAYAMPPKANVKGATKKALTFKIALYYQTADNSKFEVVVSEDFAGDFEKATWTVVKDATFAPDAPKNEWTEVTADLSAYGEKEALCVALRYTGKANTYRLDDIIIGDGTISGGGDEGDEGDEGDGDQPQEGEYTSNMKLPEADSSSDAYYKGVAVINGVEYPVLKLGKSSAGGKYTFSSLPATGNCTLTFYGVAWKGKPCKLTITVSGAKINGAETATVDLVSNDGATGNPPYTALTFASSDKYTFNLTDVTASSTITFSTQNETGPRGIFTGINLVAASAE